MTTRRYRRRRELARAVESRAAQALEAKKSPHPAGGDQRGVFGFGSAIRNYPPATIENLRRIGYEGNEIAYMGIAAIATTFAAIPIVVRNRETKEIVEGHPVAELINRGAPSLAGASGFDIRELWTTWLYVAGNGMLEKVRDASGQVVELWPIRMDRVSGKPGSDRLFDSYIYELHGKKWPLPVEDVLHARMPSLSDDYWGMSPLRAAFGRICGDNSASRLIHSWLENKGVPGVAIMSSGPVTQDKADRAREAYQAQLDGNDGGVVVLGESTALKFIAFDFHQLAMPDLMAQAESRILGTLGVPPILVGAKVGLDKASYANYANARRSFYHETVATVIRRYLELFAGDPDFDVGDENELAPDLRDNDALADERNAEHTQVREDHKAGILTRKEARVRQGYLAEVPEGLEADDPPPAPAVPVVVPAVVDPAKAAARAEGLKSLDRTEQVAQLESSIQGVARAGMAKLKAAFVEHYRLVGDDVLALIDRHGAELVTASIAHDLEAVGKSLQIIGLLESYNSQSKSPAELPELPELPEDFDARVSELEEKWGADAALRLNPLISEIVTRSGSAIGANIGVAFDIDNADVLRFVDGYTVKFAKRTSQTTTDIVRRELRKAMDGEVTVDGLRQNFERELPHWSSAQAEKVARTETNRAANHGAKQAYVQGGSTKLSWLTSSNPCEFCASLSGKIIGVEETFWPLGSEMTGTDGGKRTNRYLTVDTPPLHPHCVCTIVAED